MIIPILAFTTAKSAVIHSPVLQAGLCLLTHCIPNTHILAGQAVF